MNIDQALYKLPIIGSTYRRMHSYFKTQITITDIIHVLMGLGVGVVIGNSKFTMIGIAILVLGMMYHIYAYYKGK